MFKRFAFTMLALIIALPLYAQFAGPGVFVLEGFSNQQLSFQPMNGDRVQVAELGPTAVRLRQAEDYLCVLHGDDFMSGTGSALWIAPFDEIRDALDQQRTVVWNVVDLPDNTNPYDVFVTADHFFVSNQQSGEVVVLDPNDDFAVVRTFTNLANPQGLAGNGLYVAVANAGMGYGNTVALLNATTLDSVATLEVAANPQEITVDDQGQFHVVCSGRSWEDVPAKSAVISFPEGTPTVELVEIPGNPGEVAFMVGPEDFGGKVVFGDEYATEDVHVSAYSVPGLVLDQDAPLSHQGGWALAPGYNGIFIGSSLNNSLVYMNSDWAQFTEIHTFDGAVADLLFFDAGTESHVDEPVVAQPATLTLSAAWPNPFNASTTLTLTLSTSEQVRVELFDMTGRLAGTIYEGSLSSGQRRLAVNADRLSSGMYVVRASSAHGSAVQRITLVR